MRDRHHTKDELCRSFEEELDSVLSGGGLHSESGLDLETEQALWNIATAYPNVTGELVDAARRAFEGQLDGSHAAARRAAIAAMIEEFRSRTES